MTEKIGGLTINYWYKSAPTDARMNSVINSLLSLYKEFLALHRNPNFSPKDYVHQTKKQNISRLCIRDFYKGNQNPWKPGWFSSSSLQALILEPFMRQQVIIN